MHLYAAAARSLHARGVTTMFGLAGDANLMMIESYVREHGGEYVAAAHEAGVVLMAHAYAQTSGRVGFATVTHGPAMSNTITALIEAVRAHTPLVLWAGATPVEDRENLQFADQASLTWGTGAGFEQVRSAATLLLDLDVAFRRAVLEERPIVLNVPVEILEAEVDYTPPVLMPSLPPTVADEDGIDEALGVVASAHRPIVLAGRGALGSPDAIAAVSAFARAVGAPVATTLKAKGAFAGEDANLGIFGSLSSTSTLDRIAESDCVVAFGASLNKWTTVTGSLLDGKRIVQVDRNPLALGRHSPATVPLVGDAARTADALRQRLEEAGLPPSPFRGRCTAPPAAEELAAASDDFVDLRHALQALNTAMPADRVVVTDAGQYLFDAFKMLDVDHPRKLVPGTNFGSIGLGMANAVGASYGAEGAPVLMVSGDGGFMLGGLAEFNTAVRHGVDVVVAVFNNTTYGPEYVHLVHEGLAPDLTMFSWPDFSEVARALGGDGLLVETTSQLSHVAEAIASRKGPLLIEFRTDPSKTADEREQRR